MAAPLPSEVTAKRLTTPNGECFNPLEFGRLGSTVERVQALASRTRGKMVYSYQSPIDTNGVQK